MLVIEYHDHRGEGRGVSAVAEAESAFDKAYLHALLLIDVVVKPSCVRPRWNEHDHDRPSLCGGVGFLHPLANLPSVGRI